MKRCICEKYELSYTDLIDLAPSKSRKPSSIDCPVCNQSIQATRKSRVFFVVLLVISFIGLGFFSAAWVPADKSFWFIGIIVLGLLVLYTIVWPYIIIVESIAPAKK